MRRTPIMVCHKQGAPRKSQGNARDFWGKGETVLRHLRIAFRQAAATQMLFRRGGAEENRVVPSSAMAAGFSSDHGNFFRQHGKNFVNIIAPRGSCAFGAKFSLRSNANRRPIEQVRLRFAFRAGVVLAPQIWVAHGGLCLRRKVLAALEREPTPDRAGQLRSAFRAGVVLAPKR